MYRSVTHNFALRQTQYLNHVWHTFLMRFWILFSINANGNFCLRNNKKKLNITEIIYEKKTLFIKLFTHLVIVFYRIAIQFILLKELACRNGSLLPNKAKKAKRPLGIYRTGRFAETMKQFLGFRKHWAITEVCCGNFGSSVLFYDSETVTTKYS